MSKYLPYVLLFAAGFLLLAATQLYAANSEVDRNPGDVTLVNCINSKAVPSRAAPSIGRVVCGPPLVVPSATWTPEPSTPTPSATMTAAPPVAATNTATPTSTATATATPRAAPCEFDEVPSGALSPARVIWCQVAPYSGISTFTQGTNSWSDDFTHGLTNSMGLGPGYRTFEDGPLSFYRAAHWRHNGHWMLDYAGLDPDGQEPPYNMGFPSMRPDRSFNWAPLTWTSHGVTRTELGLVIETDYAAGIADYGNDAWGELVVTTASQPAASPRPSALYVYDGFPNFDTVGCRMHANGQHTCALFDNTARGPNGGGRTWEISFFQNEGSGPASSSPWCGGFVGSNSGGCDTRGMRFCAGTDPDTNCRDTFRWEISRTRSALYVNGKMFMEHVNLDGTPRLPDRFLSQPVYVYFGQSIIKHPHRTLRFHWSNMYAGSQR